MGTRFTKFLVTKRGGWAESDQGHDATTSYYNLRPSDKLADVIRRWQSPPTGKFKAKWGESPYPHQKVYDRSMPVMIPVKDLWPHREYTWKRDSARRSPVEWDALKTSMEKKGWDKKEPLHFNIGREGGTKVGEGNHRLAIARELGIREVPVWFHFQTSKVRKSPQNQGKPAKSVAPKKLAKDVKKAAPASPETEKLINDILGLL
jgi:hypothetical protein